MNHTMRTATLAFLLSIGMTACASKPAPITAAPVRMSADDLRRSLAEQGIRPPSATSAKWQQRTKTKVAGATALAVVGGLLGGMPMSWNRGARNDEPAMGYVDLDAYAERNDVVDTQSFDDPTAAVGTALQERLSGHEVRIQPGSPYSVSTLGAVWGLDYDRMGEEDNYRLYYRLNTKLTDGNTTVGYSDCRGVSQRRASLESWLSDEKAEVRKAAAIIGQLCAEKFVAELGLIDTTPTPVGQTNEHVVSPATH